MIHQFDVYRHPVPARRDQYPYVIVLQHDNVRERNEIVVAPFVAPGRSLVSRLYPIVEIQSVRVMLLTPALSPVALRLLRRPVANLEAHRAQIIAAIDMLFAGS